MYTDMYHTISPTLPAYSTCATKVFSLCSRLTEAGSRPEQVVYGLIFTAGYGVSVPLDTNLKLATINDPQDLTIYH